MEASLRRYLFLGILFWSGLSYATSDRLLIKRSSRPAIAEGSLEALQPWETPIEGFFLRTHHNVLPASVDDNWVVTFEGLLSKTRKMSIKQLKSMPQVSFHAVLECSGNGRALFSPQVSGIQWKRGAVGNAEWTGAPLKEIFRSLGIKENARYVTVEGYDEPVIASKAKFVRSIPIDLLVASDAILALKMNREPIPLAHGGPVRLVIPNIYGQNWIKWVTRMTFSAEED